MHGGDSFECQSKHKSLYEINFGGVAESCRKRERNHMRVN